MHQGFCAEARAVNTVVMNRRRIAGRGDHYGEKEVIVVDDDDEDFIVVDDDDDEEEDVEEDDDDDNDQHDDDEDFEEEGESDDDDDEDEDVEEEDDDEDDDCDDDEEDDDDTDDEEEEDDDDEDEDNDRTRWKQRLKKPDRLTKSERVCNGDAQKLFAEALKFIRGGNLQKLKLEHAKAYLRKYSLRRTGSKKALLDRVKEHVELKKYGGMSKYPKATFTINCTGDACTGDIVLFKQKIKSKNSTKPYLSRRIVAGRIVKESYGSDKQQHTFTVEVLWSRGPRALPLLYPLLIKGRNLYRLKTFRRQWPNEEQRKRVLQEKHSRGDVARKAREDRVSGKRHSCVSRTRLSRRKSEVKRKRTTLLKASQGTANGSEFSSFKGKGLSENTSKETGSRDSRVVSSRRQQRQYEKRFCETSRSTKCMLSIKASFAGLLIGLQGRNIGAITQASGARVQICENPTNSTSRLVEIIGLPEQVQVATGMVLQCFLDRGLPPPIVVTESTGPERQAHNSSNVLPVPNHNIFGPTMQRGSIVPFYYQRQTLLNGHHYFGL